MSRTVRIDDDVYEKLQEEAIPFQDTPNSVLRRLLNLPALDDSESEDSEEQTKTPRATGEKKSSGSRSRQARTSGKQSKKRKRAPKGSLLPESEYELPILRIIDAAGGSAPAADVVDALEGELDGKLKDLDRAELDSGRIRWQSRAQFVRLKLRDKGDLLDDSPRGIWEISEQGRQRLERES